MVIGGNVSGQPATGISGLEAAAAVRARAFQRLDSEAGTSPGRLLFDPTMAHLSLGHVTVPEPEMILIPAGEFVMGGHTRSIHGVFASRRSGTVQGNTLQPLDPLFLDSCDRLQHSLYLPDYYVSKTPVTNAQYAAFVKATNHDPPWRSLFILKRKEPPSGKWHHPVVNVSWYDALAYCRWLSEVTGKSYGLPSEAEWEKAARGTDGRVYPWGNEWDKSQCNSRERGIGSTTPAGAYAQGASPYGVLNMAGNVLEWTRSTYGKYPYDPNDGRENLKAEGHRVVRGGSFRRLQSAVRCEYSEFYSPDTKKDDIGFRVVATSLSPKTSQTAGKGE